MAFSNRSLLVWLVVFALSVVAFVISFALSAELTPKLAPITVFDLSHSYWIDFEIKSPIWDAWFDADPRIVLANLTQSHAAQFSLYKHPIFAILFYPIVAIIRLITGDVYTAVRLFFAINSFISIALLGALAHRLKLNIIDVALCCMVFLASSTMLFWYTIPERFSLGATFFLVALHVALSPRPRTYAGYAAHTAVSIGTLAVTVTNWVVGLLTTAAVFGAFDRPVAALAKWREDWRAIWPAVRLPAAITAAAFVITAVIAVIQDQFFGQASLFFNISWYLKEGEYTLEYLITPPWMRPVSIYTSSIVLGTLETWHDGARLTADNITPSTWAGWAAMVLWVPLLIRGLAISALTIVKPRNEHEILVRRMLIVTLLTLAMFTALHSVYGYVTFLYIPHMTMFIVVIFATNFIRPMGKLFGIDGIIVLRIVVLVLIATAAVNNYELLQQASSFIDERIRLGIPQR
jgi:hypothetical protein